MKRQCQFWVKRPPAHQCAKVAKNGSDFCQHHEKKGYELRSVRNIKWGALESPDTIKVLKAWFDDVMNFLREEEAYNEVPSDKTALNLIVRAPKI